jgi:ubiquinone/menaquinone biosynthesis C-methylase UbiE
VEDSDAIALIRAAVPKQGGMWADLGAGSGMFSRALAALLGPTGTVYAVDSNPGALRELDRTAAARASGAVVRTIIGDFTRPLDLPPLDGVLVANALHYVPYADQPAVVRRIVSLLTESAPMVVVEYDRRHANRWVPYPITPAALTALARDAGLSTPTIVATRPSRYSGTMYSAVVRRSGRRDAGSGLAVTD